MRYRRLGNSGLLVSAVGLGCNNFGWRLDRDRTEDVVNAAIDAGITLFDTSDTYGGDHVGGSETLLGEALKGRRDQVVLATKWGYADKDMGYGPAAGAKGGRNYLRRAVHESLRRLRTDHIDLYQLHTPDPLTPIEETLAALDELISEGKVRYIGHSNFAGWQLARAAHIAAETGHPPFVSAQNQWSLLERDIEKELVPAAETYGVGILPYFPLASGLLTGKIRRGRSIPEDSRLHGQDDYVTEAKLDIVEELAAWGAERGRSLLEIAFGGLLGRSVVGSVIAGATSTEQVRANASAGEWLPTVDELAAIDEITSKARSAAV